MSKKHKLNTDDMEFNMDDYVVREKRRPIKNYKKAWEEHLDDYDEIDDFYSR